MFCERFQNSNYANLYAQIIVREEKKKKSIIFEYLISMNNLKKNKLNKNVFFLFFFKSSKNTLYNIAFNIYYISFHVLCVYTFFFTF